MEITITAIIERASDGKYSVFTNYEFEQFVLAGYGDTVEDAKKDFEDSYEEMKSEFENLPELTINYTYDVASFLKEFQEEFSLAGLQVITGINQKQLHHYLSGHRKPSPSTVYKINNGVKNFAARLAAVEFA